MAVPFHSGNCCGLITRKAKVPICVCAQCDLDRHCRRSQLLTLPSAIGDRWACGRPNGHEIIERRGPSLAPTGPQSRGGGSEPAHAVAGRVDGWASPLRSPRSPRLARRGAPAHS